MDHVISALDEYFCEQFSDYTKISALEGFVMPNMVYVAPDGNIARRPSSWMRLNRQKDPQALLAKFKASLADTSFTFSFFVPRMRDRKAVRGKNSFRALLPEVLHRAGETVESAGEKLDIDPFFWNKIVKGRLFPEKNTVMAIALTCRLSPADAGVLFSACGYGFSDTDVRDIVVRYLLEQKIFSEELRDRCLKEYSVTNLPIKKRG